jgi:hypothetical protein
MEREEAELRALQQEEASLGAANERIATMAEELRKAELVRDRLEGLARLMGSYPEGHDMRRRLEALDVERALEGGRHPDYDQHPTVPRRYLRAPQRGGVQEAVRRPLVA